MSDRCFVIQPFDGGKKYDKRYESVFVPAIRKAGLEPYRVDRDPGTTIPIEKIESEIESSFMCLVDISEDNPNVWYELGFAMALRREVILVCADKRERFPFDVQHYSIIKYATESPQDFETLESRIIEVIKARSDQAREMKGIVKIAQAVGGLETHDIATLVAIASNNIDPDEIVKKEDIEREVDQAGLKAIAAMMGIRKLLSLGYVERRTKTVVDGFNNDYEIAGFIVTDLGANWLHENAGMLDLRREPSDQSTTGVVHQMIDEEDIPF